MDRGKRRSLLASTILSLLLVAALPALAAQPSRRATVRKSIASNSEAPEVRRAANTAQEPAVVATGGLLQQLARPSINKPAAIKRQPQTSNPTHNPKVKQTGGLLDAVATAFGNPNVVKKKPEPNQEAVPPRKAPNWEGVPYHKPVRRPRTAEAPLRTFVPVQNEMEPARSTVQAQNVAATPAVVRKGSQSVLTRPASSRLPGGNSILIREDESVASPSDLPKLPAPPSQTAQSSRRQKTISRQTTNAAPRVVRTSPPTVLSSSRRAARQSLSPLDPSEISAATTSETEIVVPKVSRRIIKTPSTDSNDSLKQVPARKPPTLASKTPAAELPTSQPSDSSSTIASTPVESTTPTPSNTSAPSLTKVPIASQPTPAPSTSLPQLAPIKSAPTQKVAPDSASMAQSAPNDVAPTPPPVPAEQAPSRAQTPVAESIPMPKAQLSIPQTAKVDISTPALPPVEIPDPAPTDTSANGSRQLVDSTIISHRTGPAASEFVPREPIRTQAPSQNNGVDIRPTQSEPLAAKAIGSGVIDPSDNEADAYPAAIPPATNPQAAVPQVIVPPTTVPRTVAAPTTPPVTTPAPFAGAPNAAPNQRLMETPADQVPRLAQSPQLVPLDRTQPTQTIVADPYRAIPPAPQATPNFTPQPVTQPNHGSIPSNRYGTGPHNTISQPKSYDDAVVASELPGIRVVTHGPKQIMIRQTHQFEIRVENRGSIDAEGVMVRAMIPDWAEIRGQNATRGSISQQPTKPQEKRLVWTIDQLPAGSTEQMFVRLRADRSGTHGLDVDWTLVPQKSVTQVLVQEPKLKLTIEGPEEVVFGKSQSYRVRVLNPGDGLAPNVVFTLSPNSPTPQTQRIGDIPPGKEAQFEVELTAQDHGDLKIDGLASGDLELRAEASKTIRVSAAKLEATLSGPEMKYQDSIANYQLNVQNLGTATSEKIRASLQLPPGVKYTSGIEQAVQRGNVLQWEIGKLPPSASRSYQFVCKMTSTGEQTIEFDCEGTAAGKATVGISTNVEAIADLVMSIQDPAAPAPVGSDVAYEITIKNRGSKAATDVRAVAQFSHGIEPRRVEGHSGEILTGQVLFDPIARLAPGEQVRLKVIANADRAGHHRFRSEIRSGDTVLVSEEATHYMNPRSERVSRSSSSSSTQTR